MRLNTSALLHIVLDIEVSALIRWEHSDEVTVVFKLDISEINYYYFAAAGAQAQWLLCYYKPE